MIHLANLKKTEVKGYLSKYVNADDTSLKGKYFVNLLEGLDAYN